MAVAQQFNGGGGGGRARVSRTWKKVITWPHTPDPNQARVPSGELFENNVK